MLFQGEEWKASSPFLYFTDHSDEELAEAVREGRRREFSSFVRGPEGIPDPQDESTFTRSKLDWSEAQKTEAKDMLQWYKDLAAFRRSHPALRRGRRNMQISYDEQDHWLMMQRGDVLLLCNFGSEQRVVPFHKNEGKVLLRMKSREGVIAEKGSFRLPAESAAVFELP
jgi:maltooligosyltrehalose trehalohydrolase